MKNPTACLAVGFILLFVIRVKLDVVDKKVFSTASLIYPKKSRFFNHMCIDCRTAQVYNEGRI